MGWAFCGEDSKGRPIGYGVVARCDHPGCKKKIDRGLGYACGGMHGKYAATPNNEFEVCEGYFCGDHLFVCAPFGDHGDCVSVCASCCDELHEVGVEHLSDELTEAKKEIKRLKTALAAGGIELPERDEVIRILRKHIRVDATGLAPVVVSAFIFGFGEAADALLVPGEEEADAEVPA